MTGQSADFDPQTVEGAETLKEVVCFSCRNRESCWIRGSTAELRPSASPVLFTNIPKSRQETSSNST